MFNKLRKTLYKFLGNSIPSSTFWGWSKPNEWNREQLIQQYTRVVYAVISAIAEDAAKIEFMIERRNKPVLNHEFLKLMRKPNPMMSQFQFLELHFTFMGLCGESYWYLPKGSISGKPKEIYLLRPSQMAVVVATENNPTGLVTGYVLTKQNGEKIPFDIDEIIHFKKPNPFNQYYGLGTVQAAKMYIETEEFASTWTRNALYNSGRPSGIVNIKGVIDSPQFELLKRQFKEEYTGTENAGKTLLLKGMDGIDYQKLSMELGEVALKEMKEMTRDDIMLMFRVSKTMLGISDDVNRANAQENHAVFLENIIKPELDRLVDHLNAFLMPRFGRDTDIINYIDMDLRSDKEKMEEWTQGHNKWLTTNDIREERGLDPIEGGDVIYQSIGLVPLTKESEKPRKPEDSTFNKPDDDKKPDDESDNNEDDEEEGEEDKKSLKKKFKKKKI